MTGRERPEDPRPSVFPAVLAVVAAVIATVVTVSHDRGRADDRYRGPDGAGGHTEQRFAGRPDFR
jgi:hypothetical protein